MIPSESNPLVSRNISRILQGVLLLSAAIFLALHALHLTADFPNHSPWMDWAKYTDEGWYADAAIRHYQRGHWYVYGDFNPAAALPVWPVLELAVFHFTGVSLAAARALAVMVFGLILIAAYLLLRRWHTAPHALAPACAVLLLAVSPFCYAFTRLAILEPLLILLTLLALLAASYAAAPVDPKQRITARRYLPIMALGLLLPVMILTKTTAVFLFPSIAWLLWVSSRYRLRPFLRTAVPAAGIAAAVWMGYFVFFVRPYFLEDYRYLFSANAYTGITFGNAGTVLYETLHDGLWIGKDFYGLALLSIFTVILLLRRRTPPLIVALLVWVAGYAAFLAYHNNLQPRYYLVLAVPLTLAVPLIFEALLHRFRNSAAPLRISVTAAAILAFAAVAFPDALQTIHYVRTPEYTFIQAAARVRQIIAANPTHNPLILSISGSDLSLMTGVPSICDDFGTMELADRVAAYHPGWYATWNRVDDDKMEALAPLYHLHRVAAFPAMDDPERNLLILYRLDPTTAAPSPRKQRKQVSHLLQTRIGQQPSAIQLQH